MPVFLQVHPLVDVLRLSPLLNSGDMVLGAYTSDLAQFSLQPFDHLGNGTFHIITIHGKIKILPCVVGPVEVIDPKRLQQGFDLFIGNERVAVGPLPVQPCLLGIRQGYPVCDRINFGLHHGLI